MSERPAAKLSPTPARAAAGAVLRRVLEDRWFVDAAESAEQARLAPLSPGDRALARRLTMTALRRLRDIDAAIDARLARPLPKKAAAARAALRIAAAETIILGGPAHAAVDAAVRIVKRADPAHAGLVNAVSRRIAESGARDGDADRLLVGRRNAAAWLAEALDADWGVARADACLAAALAPPPLDLTPAADAADWARRLGGALIFEASVRLRDADGPVRQLPGFAEGAWWVQDAAAAAPARLLGPLKGRKALDLCAAPGGKTLQLAAAGAQVTAVDVSEDRLARVRENLARTGLTADVVCADAASWAADGLFDAVLLDAPCSASGTLRRHPELGHIKSSAGLDRLTAAQDALLDAAWRRTAPGGRLVFCTCSAFKAEGEARAEAFLKRRPEAAPTTRKENELLVDPRLLDRAGRIRTLPGDVDEIGGVDGFFAAAFDKPA